jgi:uncharacterized protein (TIGR02271 family)
MSSTANSGITGYDQLVAFFRDREDAYEAVDDLRNAGFTNNEIGLAFQGDSSENFSSAGTGSARTDKSMWQKVKDFFTGGDEENDTAYSNEDLGDSYRHYNISDDQWNYYRSGINEGGAIVTVRAAADRLTKARSILQENDADFRTTGFPASGYAKADTQADQRLQLRGEMLRTYKDRVAKGEVRLRKDVVTENRSVDVPVTREEVVIERVSASDAGAASGNIGDIGEGKEIRIPVSEERVRVEKEPVVTGEVRVGKRAVQDTQRINDTVRREEVRVEKEGDVNVDEGAASKRKKPAA